MVQVSGRLFSLVFFRGIFAAATGFFRGFFTAAFAGAFFRRFFAAAVTFAFTFTFAVAFTFAAFAGFFCRSGLFDLGTAEIAESKISVYFVAAVFTYDHVAESGDFGLEVCDVGLDLVGLHDVCSDVAGKIFAGAFCGVEETADFFVNGAELGFRILYIHGQLCNIGNFTGLLGSLVCSVGSTALEIVENGHYDRYPFYVSVMKHICFSTHLLYYVFCAKSN